MTNHRDQHPVLGLDGKTDIDGARMDDPVSDQTSRSGGHLGQGNGEGSQRIEGGTGLHRLLLAVGKQDV